MGYCVTMELSGVVIPKSKIEGALWAINDLFKPKNLKKGGGATWGGNYSWVNTPPEPFTDIVAALADWRYQAGRLGPGDLVVEWFTGEKLGDDELLWSTLAPFVNSRAEILCRGEDGFVWKWVFNGKELYSLNGRMVFEGEGPGTEEKTDRPPPRKASRRRTVGLDGPRRI